MYFLDHAGSWIRANLKANYDPANLSMRWSEPSGLQEDPGTMEPIAPPA
jgi:hypothetical protein